MDANWIQITSKTLNYLGIQKKNSGSIALNQKGPIMQDLMDSNILDWTQLNKTKKKARTHCNPAHMGCHCQGLVHRNTHVIGSIDAIDGAHSPLTM